MAWKTTWYFENIRPKKHPELSEAEIVQVAENPHYEAVQDDGRFRRWGYVDALDHWVRVIIMPDGERLHNAFIDSRFNPDDAGRFGAEEVK